MVIPLFMVKRGGGDDGSIGTCAEKVRMCARERILFFDNVFLFFLVHCWCVLYRVFLRVCKGEKGLVSALDSRATSIPFVKEASPP